VWCDLALDVAGLEVAVAESVVRLDTSHGALRAPTWAADEARLSLLASLLVVHA
jgi:hypothetical protein